MTVPYKCEEIFFCSACSFTCHETHTSIQALIRVRHKHLTFFEIRKPTCQLHAASVLTVIIYSDVWSLVEMERWSVQHRTAAVDCLSKQSVTATQHGFRQQFHRRDAPSHNTLLLWVSKWRQEGSMKDSEPPGRPFSARTPDNVQRVRDTVLRRPRRSALRQALALRSKEFSFRPIHHMHLHYHP